MPLSSRSSSPHHQVAHQRVVPTSCRIELIVLDCGSPPGRPCSHPDASIACAARASSERPWDPP
eukprot:9792713-Heterocapsa_arctica.AAC.1